MGLTATLGLTQTFHSNLIIKMILILKSDFGQNLDQSEFRITSKINCIMRILGEDKSIEVRSEIIRTRWGYKNKNNLNVFLVPKLDVMQMTNPFEMRL